MNNNQTDELVERLQTAVATVERRVRANGAEHEAERDWPSVSLSIPDARAAIAAMQSHQPVDEAAFHTEREAEVAAIIAQPVDGGEVESWPWALRFSNVPPFVEIYSSGPNAQRRDVALVEFPTVAERKLRGDQFRAIVAAHNAALATKATAMTDLQERVRELERSNDYGRSFLTHIASSSIADLANPLIGRALLDTAAGGVRAMDDPDNADEEARSALDAILHQPGEKRG